MNNLISAIEPQPPHSVKIIEVIEVKSIVGKGLSADPARQIITYWLDGKCIGHVGGSYSYGLSPLKGGTE